MQRRNFIQFCVSVICLSILNIRPNKPSVKVGDIVQSKRIAKEVYHIKEKGVQGQIIHVYHKDAVEDTFPFPHTQQQIDWWKQYCPTMQNKQSAAVNFSSINKTFCIPIEDLEQAQTV